MFGINNRVKERHIIFAFAALKIFLRAAEFASLNVYPPNIGQEESGNSGPKTGGKRELMSESGRKAGNWVGDFEDYLAICK